MSAPVFFFGFQRSGTTLLSSMLDSHPQLAVPFSVTGLWLRMANQLGDYNQLRSQDDVARLVDHLLTKEERLKLWNVPFSRGAVLEGLPLADYPAIIERFHVLYAQHHGKTCWGHFDISTLTAPEVLLAWFPDARFVHLVRDARGVALSNRGIPFSLGNILECAERWGTDVAGNLEWGRALPPGRYHVVHYEALVSAPEATLTTLCNFMGLDYSPAMLGYPDAVEGRVPSDRREALWPLLTGPPASQQAERWQNEMTPSEIILVEEVAGDVLTSLGYSIQQAPKGRVGANALKLWLHLGRGNRWGRLRRRLGFSSVESEA